MKRTKTSSALADNSYYDLVKRFPLKPIAGESGLESATAMVNELVDRGIDSLTEDEEGYLDVLSDLVKKYEDAHYSIPDASPLERLKFFIEDRNTNQRTVALASGIQVSTMSEILAGRREMNLDHMKKLALHFGVEVNLFLPREKTSRPAKTHARQKK